MAEGGEDHIRKVTRERRKVQHVKGVTIPGPEPVEQAHVQGSVECEVAGDGEVVVVGAEGGARELDG